MKYLTIFLPFVLIGCWGAGDRQSEFSIVSNVEHCFEGNQSIDCAGLNLADDNRGDGESNDSEPALTCEDTSLGPVVCGIQISIDTAISNGDNQPLSDLLTKGGNEVCKYEQSYKAIESGYCELPN